MVVLECLHGHIRLLVLWVVFCLVLLDTLEFFGHRWAVVLQLFVMVAYRLNGCTLGCRVGCWPRDVTRHLISLRWLEKM